MRRLFLLAFTTVSLTAFACINGPVKSLKNGAFFYEDEPGKVPVGHIFADSETYEREIPALDSLYQKTANIEYLSDKGVMLIMLKRYPEAVALYKDIETLAPDRYATAANLGTTLELMGNNKEALHWIRKAVALDSGSHFGSEWIHVRILEAKLSGHKAVTSGELLNVDFGKDTLPSSSLSKTQLTTLRDQLYYQLNERVSFVKPKEKIVAQLLLALGDISYLLNEYVDAERDYSMASDYGVDSSLLAPRLKQAMLLADQALTTAEHKKHPTQRTSVNRSRIAWLSISATVVLLLAIFIGYRRRR